MTSRNLASLGHRRKIFAAINQGAGSIRSLAAPSFARINVRSTEIFWRGQGQRHASNVADRSVLADKPARRNSLFKVWHWRSSTAPATLMNKRKRARTGMTEEDLPRDPAEDLPRDPAPENTARAALRHAITERNAANVRRQDLETAEQLARELCSTSERVLQAFYDIDATIVEHRAEEFRRVATGDALPTRNLPEGLAARLAMRDVALKQVTAAKVTHEDLVTDLRQAEDTIRQAGLNVAIAAFDVLMAEGVRQATALNSAWNEI